MAVIGEFGNGCGCMEQCGQNKITQASPKTEPPTEEGTKAEASAHHTSEANADLYDKDKTRAMATRMMSNLKA